MNLVRVAVVLGAVPSLLVGVLHHSLPSDVQLCWQPAGHTTEVLTAVRGYVTGADDQTNQFRGRVGLLQDVSDSVYVIGDDGICHRAAVALAVFKHAADTVNLTPVLVIKAGTARYVLDDGVTKGGEFMATYVADTSFNIIGAMVH